MPVFHRPLPESLTVLRELAIDLHWSWNHRGDMLWRRINKEVWEQTQNPVSVLQLTSDQQLQTLAGEVDFVQELEAIVQAKRDYLTKPSWYSMHFPGDLAQNQTAPQPSQQPAKPLRGIAYFSMEFGLCEALPLYAGGLGMLAGDFLKTASDLGVPLIGIGLLYQQGYFHQSFTSDGWQQETYLYNDPGSLPIEPLHASDGSWLHIETQFLCRHVSFRVWKAQVGRVTLYLLDSNVPSNQARDRGITSTLYGGNTELRLMQELALGICGWRLIETLGLDIDVCHLNEGHAAFATLERVSAYRQRHKVDFEQALWATRSGNVFTTHTAVAAGFDLYPEALLRPYIGELASHLGVTTEVILALGRPPAHGPLQQANTQEPFNMAFLALRTCAHNNGVSQLHGKVSRRIFQPLYPRWPEREVPVGHVTNGVHTPTWDSAWADAEWTRICGQDRWRSDVNVVPTAPLEQLSDACLWKMATQERAQLVDYVRQRIANQLRNESSLPHCAVTLPLSLDPNILTLGFARRFAEYKRSDLLLHDPERLARLLSNSQHPVQLIVAGKAHPADNLGKQAIQRWYQFVQRPDVRDHVVLIENYDITLAQQLVQGVDVWINTPRRPWEACGTSGMKVLVNGGLNISTLDGWWAEAYQPGLGWALGDQEESTTEHHSEGDAEDAEQLYQLLENEIVPLFYQRDSNQIDNESIPHAWLTYARASMATLTPQFSSNRMLEEYLKNYYLPAAAGLDARQKNSAELAKQLLQWDQYLHLHWHEIRSSELNIIVEKENWRVDVTVYLGGINPKDIKVQMIADPTAEQPALAIELHVLYPVEGAINAYRFTGELPASRAAQDFSLRVIGAHPQVNIPSENTLIYWETKK
ncbi:MAG: alpha-glucan family phosphorylase [Pseudomonadota bacterium]